MVSVVLRKSGLRLTEVGKEVHGYTGWHWVRRDAGSEDEGNGSCEGEGLHGECGVLECDLSLRFSLLLSLYFIPDREGPRVLPMVDRLGLQCTQVVSLTMTIHVIQVDFLTSFGRGNENTSYSITYVRHLLSLAFICQTSTPFKLRRRSG